MPFKPWRTGVAGASRDCMTILAETSALLGPLIRAQVRTLPPEVRHVAGVHFGWWADGGAVLETPGTQKSVRPALTLLACQAVGGDPRNAHPAAVAVELVHNASLLHDDIIDRDPLRRGRPALWVAKGVPAAILAGDALFFAAVQTLANAPGPERSVPVLLAAVQALIEGEYLDTLLEAGIDISEDRVLNVAAGKTGELLACACGLGAAAGGAEPTRTEHLRVFGLHLGIAFQCADDVLGIWGDERLTGKPAHSDLRSRKVSFPVAAAMAADSPPAHALRTLYSANTPLSDDDCRHAADLIEQTGARHQTLDLARRHTERALDSLQRAAPDALAATELSALADLIIHRNH